MERLTWRTGVGTPNFQMSDNIRKDNIARSAFYQKVCESLANYEDTGLTPDEICALYETYDFYESTDAVSSRTLIELAVAYKEGRCIVFSNPLTASDVETIKDIGKITNNLEDVSKLLNKN